MTKDKLKLGAIFLFMLIAGCAGNSSIPSASSGSGITCKSEESTQSAYTGIGINHTNNVEVKLKNSNGRTISPSRTLSDSTSNGIEFTAQIYFDDVVSPGSYSVEVAANNKQVETYNLILREDNSPVLTIFCS